MSPIGHMSFARRCLRCILKPCKALSRLKLCARCTNDRRPRRGRPFVKGESRTIAASLIGGLESQRTFQRRAVIEPRQYEAVK